MKTTSLYHKTDLKVVYRIVSIFLYLGLKTHGPIETVRNIGEDNFPKMYSELFGPKICQNRITDHTEGS